MIIFIVVVNNNNSIIYLLCRVLNILRYIFLFNFSKIFVVGIIFFFIYREIEI